jgi:RNA polymerase sigma factor (sigma-70 family)
MFLFQKKNISEKSDEELFHLYRMKGDRHAITELFKRYANKVLYACAFYFEDKEKAKDAVMQIFQKIMEEVKGKEILNFKGWLSFVIRNHCISELRKEKSAFKRHADFYEFEYELPNEESENRIAGMNDEEMIERMGIAMKHLKETQRQCLSLFYLHQKSYKEISEMTGFSQNEVKSYIQNGKRNLKLLLTTKSEIYSNDTNEK